MTNQTNYKVVKLEDSTFAVYSKRVKAIASNSGLTKDKATELCNKWNKQESDHRALLETVKPGDKIGVNTWGTPSVMIAKGHGLYPYACHSSKKYPNSMVFESESGGWSNLESLCNLDCHYKIELIPA